MRPLRLWGLTYQRLVAAILIMGGIQIILFIKSTIQGEAFDENNLYNNRKGVKLVHFEPLPGQRGDVNLSAPNAPLLSLGNDEPNEDERIHRTFIENNLNSGLQFRALPIDMQEKLAVNLGVDKYAAFRAFNRFQQYVGKYHLYTYPTLIHPGACGDDITSALFVVHTLPASFYARTRIRIDIGETVSSIGSRLLFLMGRPDDSDVSEINEEADGFGDIIVSDFEEEYGNLTLKTIIMLEWARKNCPLAKKLVKFDEDISINMLRMKEVLNDYAGARRALLGLVHTNIKVIRTVTNKFYMPYYMYGQETYPPFARGGCYMITSDLIENLISVAKRTVYVHLEDVFLGVCMSFITDAKVNNIEHFLAYSCRTQNAVAYHEVEC